MNQESGQQQPGWDILKAGYDPFREKGELCLASHQSPCAPHQQGSADAEGPDPRAPVSSMLSTLSAHWSHCAADVQIDVLQGVPSSKTGTRSRQALTAMQGPRAVTAMTTANDACCQACLPSKASACGAARCQSGYASGGAFAACSR